MSWENCPPKNASPPNRIVCLPGARGAEQQVVAVLQRRKYLPAGSWAKSNTLSAGSVNENAAGKQPFTGSAQPVPESRRVQVGDRPAVDARMQPRGAGAGFRPWCCQELLVDKLGRRVGVGEVTRRGVGIDRVDGRQEQRPETAHGARALDGIGPLRAYEEEHGTRLPVCAMLAGRVAQRAGGSGWSASATTPRRARCRPPEGWDHHRSRSRRRCRRRAEHRQQAEQPPPALARRSAAPSARG